MKNNENQTMNGVVMEKIGRLPNLLPLERRLKYKQRVEAKDALDLYFFV